MFAPLDLFLSETPIIDLNVYFYEGPVLIFDDLAFMAQIIFAFAGVGAYFKRSLQSTAAITDLRASSLTGAVAGLIFITIAATHFLPIVNNFIFESTMVVQPIGFILVWLVPILHIALPEKHLPNAIWIILKIFAIIMVVIFGIILLDCVIMAISDESITNCADFSMLQSALYSLDVDIDEITYLPYFYHVISMLIIEFLYLTAMIFNIDLTHSNIFKKSR